jgi:hypothetical protein
MMIAAKARAAVNLAREIAEEVPLPPSGRRPDPVAYQAWEELMLTAASGVAVTVGYDCEVLDAAVGPAIEVGVNPPWRVLLQIARLESIAHAARGTKCQHDEEGDDGDMGNVRSLRRATHERAEDKSQAPLNPAAMWRDTGTWLGRPVGGFA